MLLLLEIEEDKKKILKPFRKKYTVEELLQKEDSNDVDVNGNDVDVNGNVDDVIFEENQGDMNFKEEEEEEEKKEIERIKRRKEEEELKFDEDEEFFEILRDRPRKLVRIDLNKSRPKRSKIFKEEEENEKEEEEDEESFEILRDRPRKLVRIELNKSRTEGSKKSPSMSLLNQKKPSFSLLEKILKDIHKGIDIMTIVAKKNFTKTVLKNSKLIERNLPKEGKEQFISFLQTLKEPTRLLR